MTSWRRELHRHPEFGFEQLRTAAFVAAKLREFGLDKVVEGVGGTSVVASLSCGRGARSIALRADMDALRIEERSDCEHKSQSRGVMCRCESAPGLNAVRQFNRSGTQKATGSGGNADSWPHAHSRHETACFPAIWRRRLQSLRSESSSCVVNGLRQERHDLRDAVNEVEFR